MSNIVLMEQFRDKEVRIIKQSPKEAMIPLNDIADAINYDRQSLRDLLKRNNELFESYKGSSIILTPGGPQEVICLNRDGVIGLLMKLDYNRIKDELRRKTIIEFQRWAIDTLSKILNGEMPQVEFQPWAEIAGEHLKWAKLLTEATGVKPGIAFAQGINQAQIETGRDLSEYQKLLPPAEHETAHLTPTDIGKHLGISARKINTLLSEIGLIKQHKDEKGNKYWRITEKGEEYGEEFPYVRNGHSGYQIKWNEDILSQINT